MVNSSFYTNIQNTIPQNEYYIHLHIENIGKLYNIQPNSYITQRKKSLVEAQPKNEFIRLFFKNLAQDKSVEILGNVMNIDPEELINKTNQEIFKTLSNLNFQNFSNLYNEYKNININEKLKNYFENNDKKKSLGEFTKILNLIDKYAKLILEDEDGALGAYVAAYLQNFGTRKVVDKKLIKKKNSYIDINDGKGFKIEAFYKLMSYLVNLNQAIISKKMVSTERQISIEGLSTLISQNIISTGLAQPLLALSLQQAEKEINSTLKSNKDFQLTGTQNVGSVTGKVDVKDKNFNLNMTIEGQQLKLSIELGLSNKFYLDQPFKDLRQSSITIESGSGGTLKKSLQQVFGNNYIHQYMAYNFISHKQNSQEMNYIIGKHQLIKLFSSAGSQDFVQFIIINGYIISIWDLLKLEEAAFNNVITLNYKKDKIINSNKDQLQKNNLYMAALDRSHKVNTVINQAMLTAKLHINQITANYKGIK